MRCWGELKSLRAQSHACNFQDMWKWKPARPTTSRKAGYAPDWLDKWTVIHHAIIQQSLNVIDSSQNKHIFGFTMGQHDEFCLLPRIFNLQTRTKRKNTTERWKSSEHLRHPSVKPFTESPTSSKDQFSFLRNCPPIWCIIDWKVPPSTKLVLRRQSLWSKRIAYVD